MAGPAEERVMRGVDSDLLALLTPGQLHTLAVLHESRWLYKEAAYRLGVPESTVRTTVHRSLRRAGMTDRAELAYALGIADALQGRQRARVAAMTTGS